MEKKYAENIYQINKNKRWSTLIEWEMARFVWGSGRGSSVSGGPPPPPGDHRLLNAPDIKTSSCSSSHQVLVVHCRFKNKCFINSVGVFYIIFTWKAHNRWPEATLRNPDLTVETMFCASSPALALQIIYLW